MADLMHIADAASPDPISSHDQPQSVHTAPRQDEGSTVDRSTSPTPSCLSVASAQSQGRIIMFKQGECTEGIYENNKGMPRIFVHEPVELLESNYPSHISSTDPDLLTAVRGDPIDRAGSPEACYLSMYSASNPSSSMESLKEPLDDADAERNDVTQDLNPPEVQGGNDKAIKEAQPKLKHRYKEWFENAFEVVENSGSPFLLNDIYIDLYITVGGYGKFNREHEVWQLERVSRLKTTGEISIQYNDIFKPFPPQLMNPKTVITKGIAGIGKTFSVRKFILDWAEGNANQDTEFILLLPFRDLNSKRGEEISLVELIHNYFPEMKDIKIDEVKVILIFDGLDECRLTLDFLNNPKWEDINKPASVDILLTNIIKGHLLSNSSLWITSRPAATNQLPPECVQRVTEIRGFHDAQKEKYFRKRIPDRTQAERVIKHIKSSRSLHIMCHMPVFCCMSANILQTMLGKTDGEVPPKTLTQMFAHFLLIQLQLKHKKDEAKNLTQMELDEEILVKLGKLAFQNLEKGQLVFYKEDLTNCGLDCEVHGGLFAQMFRQEFGIFEENVYCFVHLSIQEFLAALYAVIMCKREKVNVLMCNESQSHTNAFMKKAEKKASIPSDEHLWLSLCKTAVDKALQKENGELDLFLRFLFGLSLESTQKILDSHFCWTRISLGTVKETIKFIKKKIRASLSPERTINLFHCLHEMNDNSIVEEVQKVMSSGKMLSKILEPDQCSALAYILLMSERVQEVFDRKTYNTTEMGIQRLIPVVKSCKTAILDACNLSQPSCEIIVSALQTVNSHLVELDLSYNDLQDLTKLFSSGLRSENCKLEKLILRGCNLSKDTCPDIALAIQHPHSHLREIDLGGNALQDGVQQLCIALQSKHCNIEKLGLSDCSLTGRSCTYLCSVLEPPHSKLRQLVLDNNDIQNSGVEIISSALEQPHSKLEKLGLSGCRITEEGCGSLAKALKTNTAILRHLDLSYNHPGETGIRFLSSLQKSPNYSIQTLSLEHSGQSRDKPGLRKYAVQLSFDPDTTDGHTEATKRQEDHPSSRSQKKHGTVLCREALTGRCYWETKLISGSQSEISVGLTTKGEGGTEKKSWSLKSTAIGTSFYAQYFSIQDASKRRPVEIDCPPFERLGVFLDWPAGLVSFYSADPVNGPLSLLYVFHTSFTEPLYAFFKFQGPQSSFSLCKME